MIAKFEIPLPPTGNNLTTKGWHQEAALRCLLNNLHPEVAENRDELVVYGGIGKAARNKQALQDIIHALKNLENNQTLLIQSGKPVAIFPSQKNSPRVLIANSNLVPAWANWEHFRHLEAEGKMMYGQMTAGSWIYIGTQGILQGTYETFMAAAKTHWKASDLSGRIVVSCGLGGMGGAQPLAVKMGGGVFIGCDIDADRIQKRIQSKYLDEHCSSLSEMLEKAKHAKENKLARSFAITDSAVHILTELKKSGFTIDLLTDQTSAHDPLNGYVPHQLPYDEALKLRTTNPDLYIKKSIDSMSEHVKLMLEFQKNYIPTFDYGNNIRAVALNNGVKNAFDFPGFVPAYIRPLFCEGSGPFRFVALSGDPQDIFTIDLELIKLFPENILLKNWLIKAKDMIAFQGLPARICWLKYGDREKAGLMINQLVKNKKVSAPIVIGRDHLDCGSVASPNRETEKMLDGTDAVSDWPLLNAFINIAGGASWISFHHGGGVGMGYSQHAGMVIVADGTPEMDERLSLVLNSDPGMGIVRHADSGYEKAIEVAHNAQAKNKILFPSIK